MSTNKAKRAERKCSLIESLAVILVICFIFFYGSGLMGNKKVTMGMSMLLCSTLLGIYSLVFLRISSFDSYYKQSRTIYYRC